MLSETLPLCWLDEKEVNIKYDELCGIGLEKATIECSDEVDFQF